MRVWIAALSGCVDKGADGWIDLVARIGCLGVTLSAVRYRRAVVNVGVARMRVALVGGDVVCRCVGMWRGANDSRSTILS